MADQRVTELVAVVTPATTDIFAVRQAGDTRDKKETIQQIIDLIPAGGDVFKVGTPVNNQIGIWTGDGTIEGVAGLTYDGAAFDVTGNITLNGTVDGVDVGVDVPANTLKVTNATHTGQVTGSAALALAVTAITAQPASGAIVAADTILINDGGVLSEASFTQMITFFDANLSFSVGNVVKVGTPANNQIGVWTGDGTIEGNSRLTWDGSIFAILDAGLADSAKFYQDGTFFHTDFVGTAAWKIGAGLAGAIWIEANLLLDGGTFTIQNNPSTAAMFMIHDGTDLNFTHANTTDWNISGLTAIKAGTVDADFDAITGTSFGGILEANLLEAADIGVTIQPFDATILVDADIGVSVQAFDATILVDADIGVNVQAFDATILVDADIGVTVEAFDATILKDADIGVTIGVNNEAVQARRTTTLDLTVAFVDVTLDATDIETDAAVLNHDLVTNTDNIIIGVAGTYEISYQCNVETVTGNNSLIEVDSRVRLNDLGTGIPGSLATTNGKRQHGNDIASHLACKFIATLAATDFITLQVQKTDLSGTETYFIDETSLQVTRLL